MKILVIDDEQHIVDVVIYVLEENGFEVFSALDGEAGLEKFSKIKPDLVVLDLMLPGIPGLELFKKMREAKPYVPIIMLTSRSDEIDRVLGLELGADDYVTKPFSTRELAARVKSVLRRSEHSSSSQSSKVLKHGPIIIDSEKYSTLYFNKPVKLTRSEFKFVECLVKYPARVFTRDVLIDSIYGRDHIVTDRSVDAYVKRIRKKFSEINPDVNLVETVHGIGYKLNQGLE